MKTLFIDTHLWNICIILFQDGKVIKKEEVIDKKNNSELLFPTLTKVLDNEDFDEIIVVNGPGSFTGVRLGVIIAKTLAYTTNKPIKVISALECLAISNNAKMVAFNDNNGYYIGLFDDNYNVIEYKYVNNDEIKNYPNVNMNSNLDYEKIYQFCLNKEALNPHLVNPIYIKKIGVEK